jgi:hypothetical protein
LDIFLRYTSRCYNIGCCSNAHNSAHLLVDYQELPTGGDTSVEWFIHPTRFG